MDAIKAMEWFSPKGAILGFTQGYAIKEAIKEFKIPNISSISDNGFFNGLACYGIKGHYENGIAISYFLDTGCALIPICVNFQEA